VFLLLVSLLSGFNMRFFVNKKSGFISKDKNIVINDINGNIFYFKLNNEGKIIYFNLPEGEYTTNNNLQKVTEPRKFKIKILPSPNRPKKLPKEFKIFFTENPNKCSVDNVNHIIYFDNSFKDAPQFVMDYIKLHELGHYFYSGQGQLSEKNCDQFAYNEMIKLGYNPSQVVAAINYSLSDRKEAVKRKNNLYTQAKKSFLV
jgi:hypothetical protein